MTQDIREVNGTETQTDRVPVVVKRRITYSLSYLHPKLDLRRGERVSLLAERLTRAHEGPGLVRGAALVQVNHPLVALVGRRGSGGFSWKES